MTSAVRCSLTSTTGTNTWSTPGVLTEVTGSTRVNYAPGKIRSSPPPPPPPFHHHKYNRLTIVNVIVIIIVVDVVVIITEGVDYCPWQQRIRRTVTLRSPSIDIWNYLEISTSIFKTIDIDIDIDGIPQVLRKEGQTAHPRAARARETPATQVQRLREEFQPIIQSQQAYEGI